MRRRTFNERRRADQTVSLGVLTSGTGRRDYVTTDYYVGQPSLQIPTYIVSSRKVFQTSIVVPP